MIEVPPTRAAPGKLQQTGGAAVTRELLISSRGRKTVGSEVGGGNVTVCKGDLSLNFAVVKAGDVREVENGGLPHCTERFLCVAVR